MTEANTSKTDYYGHPRPEVVALVPADVRAVVDVGCASGALGQHLKSLRPEISVRGIEPVAAVAKRASEVLDDVLVGSAEDPPPKDWPKPDCVIFADVLEHLVDPWGALRTWTSRLAHGGCVVASIPNVAHHSVVRPLLRGRFDYVDAGILDRTHLRFFTRSSVMGLFADCGLKVESLGRVVDPSRSGRAAGWLAKRGASTRTEGGPMAGISDIWTIQFLVVARPL